jgi:hypothetical protein
MQPSLADVSLIGRNTVDRLHPIQISTSMQWQEFDLVFIHENF